MSNDLTKDEVIAMAHEADDTIRSKPFTAEMLSFLERFATLCRAPLVADVERLNADMKQMGVDLSAIQEIHNQQKAKLYADLADWKARALKAEQAGEPTPNDVVAGALYDFLGYLTSRRTRVTMSDRDAAGPAVDALVDWSKTRKITLEEARVEDWQNYTTPPQPAAQEPVAWRKKSANGEWVLYYQNVGWKDLSGFEPLYPIQKSAVPVVEQLVEALDGLTKTPNDDSPESVAHCILFSGKAIRAIAAGQKFIKENGE